MSTIKLSVATRTSRATTLNTAVGSACLVKIYSGSAPTDPDTAATGTLLATLTGGSPFGSVTSGVLTANAITQANAVATGTAGYCRICVAANTGSTAAGIIDLDVGTSGTSVIMNTTSIVTGGPVQITSAILTEAA